MKPLAVYVHIPFCVVKCGYCDFNTYSGLDSLKDRYAGALLLDAARWRPKLETSRVISVSFGGGTPGEFPAGGLAALVAAIREAAGAVSADAEVSLEANPGTTSLPELERLAAAGFNRVSFGAQSFDPGELRFLDRIHSPEATVQSVENARRAGFGSVGLDLIYGLPGQRIESFESSLRSSIGLGVEHISCYALTVEEGTPLARRVASAAVPEPDPDTAADMYVLAERALDAVGYHHYEISNWARPGQESRHNSVYWDGGDYLALGAGAHGFLDGERYENLAHPAAYMSALSENRSPIAHSYRPAGAMAIVDRIETGLRLIDGFDLASVPADNVQHATILEVLRECEALGLIASSHDRVQLTPRGRLFHSEVCARLLARLS